MINHIIFKNYLKAKGGSGGYSWSSMNKSIVSVNNRGLISTESFGEAQIKVRDVRNSFHFGLSLIKILPPEEIIFLDTVVEVEVGKLIVLPVNVYAFTQGKCSCYVTSHLLTFLVTTCYFNLIY